MIEHNNFSSLLHSEIKELKELLTNLEADLSSAPEGSLHVMQRKGSAPAYYSYHGRSQRKYIPKDQIEIASCLAQKEYNKRLIEVVRKRVEYGIKLEETYKNPLIDSYTRMIEPKRKLVKTFELSDEDYVKRWYEENKGGMNTYPINTELYSNCGENMRSKSEMTIANMFDRYNIPYIYEPRLILTGGRVVFPDFMVMNLRLRKTFIYEHFGIMSDSEYADKTSEKIAAYNINGYFPGKNFLFSMESSLSSLNTKIIERIIEEHLQ